MPSRLTKCTLCQPLFVAVLTLAGSPASAQQSCQPYPQPPGCAPGSGSVPYYVPGPNMMGLPGGSGMGEGSGTNAGAGEAAPSFGNLASGADVGATAALGAPGAYLDSAIPQSTIKLRYDGEFNINRPDRAEYIYGTWRELAFHPHGIVSQNGSFKGTFQDPRARGPEQFPGSLNVEEASVYMEYAPNNRFSGFADVPVRFLNFTNLLEDNQAEDRSQTPSGGFKFPEPRVENTNPDGNDPSGLSDIQLGIKYALLADPCQYLTFQLRTYIPTGNASRGLGTGHVSLEPSLLYYQRLSDRLELQGQFTDWVPVGGGPEAGNVLSYGIGVGYTVYNHCNLRITPVAEVVGWTVLSGLESIAGDPGTVVVPAGITVPTTHGVQEAAGDTIVNLKFGVRTYLGRGQDFYVGYGRAVTGDRWYKDIVTAEYRFSF